MREGGHVAAGEGRLLPGDRVEREAWIGDDAGAVLACDGAVHFGAIRLFASTYDPLRGRADLVLRLQPDALRLEAPMIDPRVDIELGQPGIGELRPAFAPALEQVGTVPLPDLGTEADLGHGAHGQHDVGVGFGHAVVGPVPVDVEIGDHAAIDELGLDEVARQVDRLRLGHLARQGEFQLARELCVAAELEGFDLIPEAFPVGITGCMDSPNESTYDGVGWITPVENH